MSTTAPGRRVADAEWLERAVRLATDSVARGGGPFGAVIVRDGEELATGTNEVTTSSDPTAHAEIVAIRAACRRIGDFRLSGCLLVVSCEPCPMCLFTMLWARVDRVVYAAGRDDAAAAGFDDRKFHDLFAQPNADWPIAMSQLSIEDQERPFAEWRAQPDHVDY
jgi:tRNA(Arg) A34 adenosine deaminase TadA